MTEERILAAFGRLDAAVVPDPAFADRLFDTLAGEIEWGTMPNEPLRVRILRALGLAPVPAGRSSLRLTYLAAMLALLLTALGAALFVASRLQAPTPGDLVYESQTVYEHPPAFSVTYRMPLGGDIRLSSDGAGTWRIESTDEGSGTYWLWDGDSRVGRYDPATGWVAGSSKDVGIMGPPGPLWVEYTWGTGEIFADDPVRHVIPCSGAVATPDDREILGHPTDHVLCPDIGMDYWLDRETHLILRMQAGPRTPHWSGMPGTTEVVVEATAFDVGPQPPSAFDWRGPGGASATPSPSAPVVPYPALPAVAAGIASDQPCVTQLDDPGAVAEIGIAPRELEALLLDAESLGAAGDGWGRDPWLSAYMHNIEVVEFDAPTRDSCEVLERLGRVIGYMRTYGNETSGEQLSESVDVFLTEDGAAAYVAWFAAAMENTIGATSEDVDVGEGGLDIRASSANGDRAWIVFRSGRLVATLGIQGRAGDAPPASLTELAARLDARITAAALTGRPYDLTHLMSGTVPKADLPRQFVSLGWDPVFGGCWDHAEMIEQSSDPTSVEREIATYGHEISCLGMYSPDGECGPGGCPSPAPETGAPVGVIRVATGLSVLASPQAARGYFDATLARIERSGSGGVERFAVPGVAGAVGLRRHVVDGDTAHVDTRVVFVRGDLVAVAYVHDRTENDHTADVIAMAKALDARLAAVLGGGTAP